MSKPDHSALPLSLTTSRPTAVAPQAGPMPSYLGPPALLAGEDRGGYDALLVRIIATLKPQDALEDIFTRDVVDLTWEILRLRRLKAALLHANTWRGLADVLAVRRSLLPTDDWETAQQWACGDGAASAAVSNALQKCGLTMEAARARTFARDLDDIERMDRMMVAAERRRETLLAQLDRHRAGYASPLRRALDEAEDAEFTELASDAVR